MMSLQEFRAWFDGRFNSVLGERILEVTRLTKNVELVDALKRVQAISSSGKRIRPYIASLAYASEGARLEDVLDALIGIELFHAFCLIHDDVIDRAGLRRGEETVHSFFLRSMRGRNARGEAEHLSNSQAILVGDLVFGWALDSLYSAIGANARAWKEVRAMMDEVVIGQMVDVDLMSKVTSNESEIEEKMYLKTASYTFVRPLRIGFALAGIDDPRLLTFCDQFGKHLGIGFQIQDDLLDVMGDEQKTGKKLFSDVRDGQHTYISMKILSECSEAERATFSRFFGVDFSSTEEDELARFFRESSVVPDVRRLMFESFGRAEALLDEVAMNDTLREELSSLLKHISARSS